MPAIAPLAGGQHAIGWALALPLVLLVSASGGCQTPERVETPEPDATTFVVYDVSYFRGDSDALSEEERQVLTQMIRDAVGPQTWFRTHSSVRMLGDIMAVRTTPEGHQRIEELLAHIRMSREAM